MQRFTSINNIFYNDHILAKQIIIQADRGNNIAGRFHAFVRSQFNKTEFGIDGQIA